MVGVTGITVILFPILPNNFPPYSQWIHSSPTLLYYAYIVDLKFLYSGAFCSIIITSAVIFWYVFYPLYVK
jgi:hypothetical protein